MNILGKNTSGRRCRGPEREVTEIIKEPQLGSFNWSANG